MLKLLNKLLTWLNNTFKFFLGIFTPETAFSWQTLIGLSLFSWGMSFLATSIFHFILASFSWFFLILGVYWATTSNKSLSIGKILLSPWITGALITCYIFGIFTGELPTYALVIWPLISAVIAALPICLDQDFRPMIPAKDKRQSLVWILTTQLILSCWFQFYFLVQNWLIQYPTITVDTFKESAFVVRINPDQSRQKLPRGITILDLMASRLKKQLNNQPWFSVEEILLIRERDKLIQRIEQIKAEVMEEIASPVIKEDSLWEISLGDIYPGDREGAYRLELQALWQGPRSQPEPNLITQSCQIKSVNQGTDTDTALISQVQCDPAKGWGVGEPLVSPEPSNVMIDQPSTQSLT